MKPGMIYQDRNQLNAWRTKLEGINLRKNIRK